MKSYEQHFINPLTKGGLYSLIPGRGRLARYDFNESLQTNRDKVYSGENTTCLIFEKPLLYLGMEKFVRQVRNGYVEMFYLVFLIDKKIYFLYDGLHKGTDLKRIFTKYGKE